MAGAAGVIENLRRVPELSVSDLELIVGAEALEATLDAASAKEIAGARDAMSAINAFDMVTAQARSHLSASPLDAEVVDLLEAVFRAWHDLEQAELVLQEPSQLCLASRVPLRDEERRSSARTLCHKLIGAAKALSAQLYSSALGPGEGTGSVDFASVLVFEERLSVLLASDWVKQLLAGLGLGAPLPAPAATAVAPTPSPIVVDATAMPAPPEASPERKRSVTFVEEQKVSLPHASSSEAREVPPKDIVASGPADCGRAIGRQAVASAAKTGSEELWTVVHLGDEAALRRLMAAGSCTPDMKDASGHSVLWHLVAFGHLALALLVLDTFPADLQDGADLTETHPSRGDTLLHVLCRASPFGKEAAELFKRAARVLVAGHGFSKRNSSSETFLDVAAASLNFWVFKFALRNFAADSKGMICGTAPLGFALEPPLRILAGRLMVPRQPAPPHAEQGLLHLELVKMLAPDVSTGVVPYADIAFEVGRDGERSHVLAHRVVIGARSKVLCEEFQKLPPPAFVSGAPELYVFRVDARISKEVWNFMVHYLYTGEFLGVILEDLGRLIQLLRACMLYQMPRQLLEYAGSSICPLLQHASPRSALEVFSIAAGKPPDPCLLPARECSAYCVLRSAHELFGEMDPSDASSVLDEVLQTVEDFARRPLR